MNARAREEKIDNEAVENSRFEAIRCTYLGGTLGAGVVMMSDEQFETLCERLTADELERYLRVVRDCELKGKHYGKSHYKAILDMAKEDRKV